MIYCLNCGKGIPDQSKFCTFCGTPTAQIDPQNPNNATQQSVSQNVNPTPPPQETVTPSPPQQPYVNPNPPQQQYIPPPQQQYVPPPQQQYVNPQQQYVNPSQPVYSNQPYSAPQQRVAAGATNEFYKNAGFWGAAMILVGFFLPYVSQIDASFYYLVTEFGSEKPELYLYLIFPVCGGLLVLQSLTGMFPKGLVVVLKILPLLLIALLIIGGSQSETSFGFMGDDVGTILKNTGIGLYMIVIGTILVLFYKTTKRKA